MSATVVALAVIALPAAEAAPLGAAKINPAKGCDASSIDVTIEWEVFCVMRFQAGRLLEIRNYFDRETALEEADLDRSISHH